MLSSVDPAGSCGAVQEAEAAALLEGSAPGGGESADGDVASRCPAAQQGSTKMCV